MQVAGVVEPDGQDFARYAGRQQLDVGQGMNVVDHFVGFEGAGAQLFHVVALNDSIADLAVGEIPGDSHLCFS